MAEFHEQGAMEEAQKFQLYGYYYGWLTANYD
jgi:hypothetical protein